MRSLSLSHMTDNESKHDRQMKSTNTSQMEYCKANADRIRNDSQGHLDEFRRLRAKCDYKYFDVSKRGSSNLNRMRQNDPEHVVILFPEYLEKVKEKFDENSKEYLMARLCNEIPARDEMSYLEIVPTIRNNDNIWFSHATK